MILSKAGRYTLLAGLLCLLLMAFAGASYAGIRWQVVSAPTEVITTGMSEVLGSITMIVEPGQGPVITGNVAGGPSQIAILYNTPLMQIDNTTTTGVVAGIYRQVVSGTQLITTRLYDFVGAGGITVQNVDLGSGNFAGQVTLNLPIAFNLLENDFIRLDGVRGRINLSALAQPTTDAFVRIQSINDPSANQFSIDVVRVALSYLPFQVAVTSAQATLCLPPYGAAGGSFLHTGNGIVVTERFNRAFVAKDSGAVPPAADNGADLSDRLDSTPNPPGYHILGSPTSGTLIKIILNNIPNSVSGVSWPTLVASNGGGYFSLTTHGSGTTAAPCTGTGFGTCFSAATAGQVSPPAGVATAVYEFYSTNQAGASDITLESFNFTPELILSTSNQQDQVNSPWTGVRAGVSLWPWSVALPTSPANAPFGTSSPNDSASSPAMPRFVTNFFSTNDVASLTGNDDPGAKTAFGIYETFARCVCYLLYPYVAYIPPVSTTNTGWNTGVTVSNTTDDSGALAASMGAPDQAGAIQFWLYDFRLGNLLSSATTTVLNAGIVYPDPGHTPPPGNNGPATDPIATSPTFGAPIYYAGQTLKVLVSQIIGSSTAAAAKMAANSVTDFAGYIIAKANFQFCHGFAFIADGGFSTIAQGYTANVMPDPSVKGGRLATAAAEPTAGVRLYGETLNN